ncbi:MAG: calcium/sodium antiporter [Rhodothermia bacterium]|nr:calcium/sodium antiporter [Rhodothermia bacterium]
MTLLTFLMLAAGLALLVFGADFLVKGASNLALSLGISPIIIGLTIVAYGTSMPEFTVSTMAAYAGAADISIGNVVGSNIFNVLFILGVSALISPLIVHTQLIRIDVPVMIGASVLLYLLSMDGVLGKIDAVILAMGAVGYTWFQVYQSRKEKSSALGTEIEAEFPKEKQGTLWVNLGWIAVGLVLLILGSNWLVTSATEIARWMGVSELVIGLTIVAIGTSLPEVATSVAATLKGERDIAVGNVIGSNIFNILAVLGFSGLISPKNLAVSPSALAFDIPVMIAVALACFPIFFAGKTITRVRGAVFFCYYIAYTVYLILATGPDKTDLHTFQAAFWYFALPLTVLMLLWLMVGGIRERRIG